MSTRKSEETKRPRSNNRTYDQPAWKRASELPDFLDASASVSASTFGARRLPEIKALWNVAVSSEKQPEDSLKSSGCKTSSRHLRRRVASYKSRRRHRYPEANHINLERKIVDPSRKANRGKKSYLCLSHESWWRGDKAAGTKTKKNSKATTSKSPPLDWLMTHIWHAKRMHMADLWGWQIPMVHNNRGPKAALRLIREGKTLIQDATYSMAARPIVFQGTSRENMQTVMKRLCPDFAMAENQAIERGQGIFFGLDQFPRNAIGPVTWITRRGGPLMGSAAKTKKKDFDDIYIHLSVHPQIHEIIQMEVEALIETFNYKEQSAISKLRIGFTAEAAEDGDDPTGMSCFKLRGINATRTLQKVLKEDSSADSNRQILDDDKLHLTERNGTAIFATVKLDHPQERGLSNVSGAEDSTTNASAVVGEQSVLLVSYCVRDPNNLPQNAPALGWDLYCDACIARELFVALVVVGQACPIGLLEDAYMNLECQPPLATVFPRDFVETEAGRKYWQSGGAEEKTPLTVLRMCLEEAGGGGRVPVPLIKTRSCEEGAHSNDETKISPHRLGNINWNTLTKIADDENGGESNQTGNDSVVMMRGMYGRPLIDALDGAGEVANLCRSEDGQQKRRNRRPVRRPNELCRVNLLSREQADAHMHSCSTLLQSLSLPAVVACQLQVVGTGTLMPGACIYSPEDSETKPCLLGHVTAESFSVGRGRSCGTGIVGASPFLRSIMSALSSVRQTRKSLAAVDYHGTKNIQLVVRIGSGDNAAKATLALIL